MTCSNCTHWKLRTDPPTNGDNAMVQQNYRNCLSDNRRYSIARYVHGDAAKCAKFEVKSETENL